MLWTVADALSNTAAPHKRPPFFFQMLNFQWISHFNTMVRFRVSLCKSIMYCISCCHSTAVVIMTQIRSLSFCWYCLSLFSECWQERKKNAKIEFNDGIGVVQKIRKLYLIIYPKPANAAIIWSKNFRIVHRYIRSDWGKDSVRFMGFKRFAIKYDPRKEFQPWCLILIIGYYLKPWRSYVFFFIQFEYLTKIF